MELQIRHMTKEDIPQALEIERLCFSEPWTEADYRESLLLRYARYYVAVLTERARPGSPETPGGPEILAIAGEENNVSAETPGKLSEDEESEGAACAGTTDGAAKGQIIVGICGVRQLGGDGEITNVAVRPAFRGQGIARSMLEMLLAESRRDGVRDFTLEVRAGNAPAIALYEGLGFRPEGVRPGFYTKPVEDALIEWLRE